ncbi:hypothetical protein [Streptomyces griseocarneus]|uniref:hypothetical protein n=1 Tax=Streptomyces griseocarneus TaxID=51201 RepID=UPI00167CB556|nr:hypothetical protein [Streptomyces griseocarneus]MBZ6477659.1 hypothetical protein [Streptomyces griseocarneus]GHG82072.1 hypothetical protein GCM10018779_64610 [Streptomyces griseocarneus]
MSRHTPRKRPTLAKLALTTATAAVSLTLTAPTAAAPKPASTLQSASIRFHTENEDKDGDTRVTITVRDRNRTVVAEQSGDLGQWDEGEDSPEIGLVVHQASPLPDLSGGTVHIRIDPVGHDTWAFTFRATMRYSGGESVIVNRDQRITLSEENRDADTQI